MSERFSSRRAFLLGLVGLLLVIAALVLNRPSRDEPALPTTAEAPLTPPPVSGPPATASSPLPVSDPAVPPPTAQAAIVPDPAPAAAAPSLAEPPPTAAAPRADPVSPVPPVPAAVPTDSKPSFDVVRVNPQGDAVIAGRAQPEANVTVLDGDTPIGTVTADKRGEWVLLPDRPLPSGDRELSLSAVTPGGAAVDSDQVVVLSIPAGKAPAAANPATDPAVAPTPERPLALVVNRDGTSGSTLLQAPSDLGGSGRLTVDTIDYGQDGSLQFAGRGEAGHGIRAYVNNNPIGDAEVGGNGLWRLRPEGEVPTGPSTLRVDLLTPQGKVAQRLELPFARATPEQVRLAADGRRIIVQPGNSLWRIARRIYGGGVHYTVIYQ